MNFLAHAVLADISGLRDLPDHIISADFLFGAVCADAFKRQHRLITKFLTIQDGMKAHEDLDVYFDNDPSLRECRRNFRDFLNLGSISPVLFDVCCDHILAKKWDVLFFEPLGDFAYQVNGVIRPRIPLFPLEKQERARNMVNEKWLLHYRTKEGLSDALLRIAHRFKTDKGDKIIENLDKVHKAVSIIEPDFLKCIPATRLHCRRYVMEVLKYDPGTRLHWKADSVLTPEGQRNYDKSRLL